MIWIFDPSGFLTISEWDFACRMRLLVCVQHYKRWPVKSHILVGVISTDDFILKYTLVCIFQSNVTKGGFSLILVSWHFILAIKPQTDNKPNKNKTTSSLLCSWCFLRLVVDYLVFLYVGKVGSSSSSGNEDVQEEEMRTCFIPDCFC